MYVVSSCLPLDYNGLILDYIVSSWVKMRDFVELKTEKTFSHTYIIVGYGPHRYDFTQELLEHDIDKEVETLEDLLLKEPTLQVAVKMPGWWTSDPKTATTCCMHPWYSFRARTLFKEGYGRLEERFPSRVHFLNVWEQTLLDYEDNNHNNIHPKEEQIEKMIRGQLIPKLCPDCLI